MNQVFVEALLTELNVVKHEISKYDELAECGVRILFEMDEYRFLDGNDKQDKVHYLLLEFAEDGSVNSLYEFSLESYYHLITQYLMGKNEKVFDIIHEIEITF